MQLLAAWGSVSHMFEGRTGNGSESQQTYWAARPADELRSEIDRKERRYFEAAVRRGLRAMWSIAWAQYYGTDPSNPNDMATQTLSRTGPEAEFTRFRINEVRSFIRQQNVIAQGERPAFQCLALNSDYDALSSCEISDAVVGYIYKQAIGEGREREILEAEGVWGAAYGHLRWDSEGGDEVQVSVDAVDPQTRGPVLDENGTPAKVPSVQMSGAPYVNVCAPWDVALDPSSKEMRWAIVRERVSKWELAATYPERAEDILNSAGLDEWIPERLFGHNYDIDDDDDCVVHHFYHSRCRAIEGGRYVGICGDVVLWDLPCPVKSGLPLVEMASGKFFGSAFGYADSWDLIAIQEMIDQLCSDTASNLSTFGRNTIVYDKGSSLDPKMIAMGLRALAKLPGSEAPSVINYAQMPDSVQWFLTYLHSRHESISGMNSVARGNPGANIKSGQMAALFHAIAIEFQSARQAALDWFREQMANMMLDMVRANADSEFLVEVAGVGERPYLRSFSRQSLAGVRKVRVETTNPLMRSQAGRFEMFQALKDVEPDRRDAVIRGLTTGNWSGFVDDSKARDLRIQWENEQLSNGVECRAGAGDHPFRHIPAHWALFEKLSSSPDADPNVIYQVLSHINDHLMTWQWIDPRLASTLGIPLPPPIFGSPTAMLGMAMGAPTATQPQQGGVGASSQQQNTSGGGGSGSGSGSGQSGSATPQERDSSGVKLPNQSEPPPGANVQSQG